VWQLTALHESCALLFAIVMTACSRTPSQPSVSNVAGTWTGGVYVTSSCQIIGCDARPCSSQRGNGKPWPLQLLLFKPAGL